MQPYDIQPTKKQWKLLWRARYKDQYTWKEFYARVEWWYLDLCDHVSANLFDDDECPKDNTF